MLNICVKTWRCHWSRVLCLRHHGNKNTAVTPSWTFLLFALGSYLRVVAVPALASGKVHSTKGNHPPITDELGMTSQPHQPISASLVITAGLLLTLIGQLDHRVMVGQKHEHGSIPSSEAVPRQHEHTEPTARAHRTDQNGVCNDTLTLMLITMTESDLIWLLNKTFQ